MFVAGKFVWHIGGLGPSICGLFLLFFVLFYDLFFLLLWLHFLEAEIRRVVHRYIPFLSLLPFAYLSWLILVYVGIGVEGVGISRSNILLSASPAVLRLHILCCSRPKGIEKRFRFRQFTSTPYILLTYWVWFGFMVYA